MLDLTKHKEAEAFLSFFAEISKIPRGSGNTKGIADHLASFARSRNLEFYRDEADNVVIKKPATKGYENRPTVMIQGHTDMVLQAASGVTKDMDNEGVELVIDGDFLRAEGTTLGADDGIAVAYALAILDSRDIPHPDIEAIFTSDEEIGLIGATALDCSELKGKTMINIDSDIEGVFTVGCAGGRRVDIKLPVERADVSGNKYTLIIDGLLGGHSGVEIDKGRTNATKRIAEYLAALGDIRLVSLSGGVADNAIPPSATAEFISDKCPDAISEIIDGLKEALPENAEHETVTLIKSGECDSALTAKSTDSLTSLICELPSGIIAMSKDIEGQVETSLNLGILRLEEGHASISFSLRSSKEKEKQALADRVASIAGSYGAEISEHGDYPGWEFKKDSHLREVMCKVYGETYGKDAEVITIHAGLECGIFSDKIEGLDCVSAGPDAFDIHTPKERLSISSAVRFWNYLLNVLKNI